MCIELTQFFAFYFILFLHIIVRLHSLIYTYDSNYYFWVHVLNFAFIFLQSYCLQLYWTYTHIVRIFTVQKIIFVFNSKNLYSIFYIKSYNFILLYINLYIFYFYIHMKFLTYILCNISISLYYEMPLYMYSYFLLYFPFNVD